jgi:Cys-tRNA(Pro)/Cys-tRNA(Cys) deacylase
MAARDTPATTAARRARVAFTLHEYEHDPAASSYGMEAAEALGLDPARVFKTLVADLDGTLTVCIVPVAHELDLRSLGKRAKLADTVKAERTTGYVAGGISPLGQRRALPTLVDETALEHDTVFVSAGRRGLEIELAPGDLVSLTQATVRPLRR